MMYSLRRVLAQIGRSQTTVKRIILYSPAHQFTKATTKTTTSKDVVWPKPSEIPFQVKVANSVNLIGHVDAPVQFQTSSDGKHWAGTVVVQHAASHSLWIPILFEGDLAHIASSHLKKDDHVHIAGQLTADSPAIEGQANVQVMVHSLNLIEPTSQKRMFFVSKKQAATVDHSVKISSSKKDGDSALSSWRDLLDNPEQWRDYRSDKLKGLVKPRYPDFKRKDGTLPLWLNSAPDWVLSELEGVVFDKSKPVLDDQTRKSNYVKKSKGVVFDKSKPVLDDQTQKSNYVKKSKADDFWKDLVENPDKWWDNRLDKKSEKGPDFKHKETGKPLWLNYSPAWVRSQLPPVKSTVKVSKFYMHKKA
ncbi:hypothetical protein AB3S75_005686 [Citrus x aurantiifolia]